MSLMLSGRTMMTANPEYERHIAGVFLHKPELITLHADLQPVDFSDEFSRLIVTVARWLQQNGDPVGVLSVAGALRDRGRLEAIGGPTAIAELYDEVAFTTGLDHYIRTVKMLSARRSTGERLAQLLAEARQFPDSLDDGEAWQASVAKELASAANGICTGQGLRPLSEYASETMAQLRRVKETGVMPGISHGLGALAEFMPSLYPTDLITIAARPGMGKSALIGQMCKAAAEDGKVVALFSLEMSGEQLVLRMISGPSGVPMHRLRSGQLYGPEEARVVDELARVAEQSIYVDDTARLTAAQVRARVLQLVQQLGEGRLGLVAVDYLQLLKGTARLDRREQISEMTKELKALAKEVKVPVVQLAQLNRKCEERTNKRPLISDLKEAGAIEEDSDVILFPFRPAYYDDSERMDGSVETAEIAVAKQRNGPTGVALCGWDKQAMEFVEASW